MHWARQDRNQTNVRSQCAHLEEVAKKSEEGAAVGENGPEARRVGVRYGSVEKQHKSCSRKGAEASKSKKDYRRKHDKSTIPQKCNVPTSADVLPLLRGSWSLAR